MLTRTLSLLTFSIAAALATAQIRVMVNNEPVSFPGQGPAMMNGRILVPLRGVMEKIGASVKWEAATSTVVAIAGNRDVRLRIGDEFAMVAGQAVKLDQPAVVVRGTTMVPLRFMGEALGAEVKWDGATSTVYMTTGSSGNTGNTGNAGNTGTNAISSIEFQPRGWSTVGGQIQVTLRAPSGGRSFFSMPGVVEEFAMSEVSAGVYRGTYSVPEPSLKTLQVDGVPVIGVFRLDGKEHVRQADQGARIDNVKPSVTSPTPADKATINDPRPSVSALVNDLSGSGINTAGLKVTLDAKDVSADATVTKDFVALRPAQPLAAGKHNVTVTARDVAGNVQSLTWSFTISSAPSLVKSLSHNGIRALKPGDVVQFNLEAQAKGQAVVTLVKNKRTVPMREVTPGRYQGEYTVRRDDDFADETAIATFTAANGQKLDFEAPRKVGSTASTTLGEPQVTSPKAGATVTSPLTITGTAPGAAQVKIKVTYRTVLAGNFPLGGTLYQQALKTDANGGFEAKDIDVSLRIKGSDTTYTIEVVGVTSAGKESKATTVVVKG
ncbi:MAG: hypothetical protein IT207_11395 [Fimbriimonadaceae bacterium]|nr:hypothetical protein [Fimbriimonadaceae bacterium]